MQIFNKILKFYGKYFFLNILGIILYRLLLDFCYVSIVTPKFNYLGLTYDFTLDKFIISWIFLLSALPFILFFINKANFSNNVICIMFYLSYVPTSTLLCFLNYNFLFLFLVFFYWFILFFLNIVYPYFKFRLNSPKIGKGFVWSLLLILVLTVIYISGRYTDFRFHLGIFDVYKLRFEEREFQLPLLLSYVHTAAASLLPVLMIYFFIIKKPIISLIIGFIIFLNFGIGGHKFILFILILSLMGYWFFRFNRLFYFCWILILILVLSLIEFYLFDSFFVSSLFTYRTILVPSQLHFSFFEFFINNEFDFFRQGILRWFGFNSPYSINIDFLVAYEISKDITSRANNGLFSDAFMNLGYLGPIIFPLFLITVIRLIDMCSKGLEDKLLFVPVVIVSLTFLSTTLTTALLTNGIFLLMITLLLLPRNFNTTYK